jgi:hypothetical protein
MHCPVAPRDRLKFRDRLRRYWLMQADRERQPMTDELRVSDHGRLHVLGGSVLGLRGQVAVAQPPTVPFPMLIAPWRTSFEQGDDPSIHEAGCRLRAPGDVCGETIWRRYLRLYRSRRKLLFACFSIDAQFIPQPIPTLAMPRCAPFTLSRSIR